MCHNVKKDDGKCISTNVKLTATSCWSESISQGFQTLLHTLLNTLEIFVIAIRGLGVRSPYSACGKICCIKT